MTHSITSFSPTQIKNYQVQGFATADIVPLVLGKVYRWLRNSQYDGKALFINTIHDSLMLDCISENTAISVAKSVKVIMEEAVRYLKNEFNIDFNLPLKAEAEIGRTWNDMKKLDI